jgi:DNA polymerase-3 subunit alpha
VRVPVVAEVRQGPSVRYVRLGPQFCVRDPVSAAESLQAMAFTARCSGRLVAA